MGVFSRLEGGLDSAFDKAAGAVFRGPIEPAQIAKRAEKQMNREKLVGAGKQYAPTLYTVLVNENDDSKLFGFYPTMAAEIETYLMAKGSQNGLKFDGRPLVRFIVDKKLKKSGKFDVIAENVSAPIVAKLRDEEAEYYGIKNSVSKRSSIPKLEPGNMQTLLPGGHIDDLEPDALDALDALDTLDPFGDPISRAADADAVLDAALGAAGGAAISGANAFNDSAEQRQRIANIASSTPNTVLGQARLSNLNAGLSYPLSKPIMIIGRDESCDISINDANTSRRHAQLTQDVTGTWKITDLESTNGSKLNGSPVISALLRDGDELTFGITTFEFREI